MKLPHFLHVWSLHLCYFDSECQYFSSLLEDGTKPKRLNRVHLNTPWAHFSLALNDESTFSKLIPGTDDYQTMWFTKGRNALQDGDTCFQCRINKYGVYKKTITLKSGKQIEVEMVGDES